MLRGQDRATISILEEFLARQNHLKESVVIQIPVPNIHHIFSVGLLNEHVHEHSPRSTKKPTCVSSN